MKLKAAETCREMLEGSGFKLTEDWGDEHLQTDSPLTPCCARREVCGGICGTSDQYCDRDLLKCMRDTCAAMGEPYEDIPTPDQGALGRRRSVSSSSPSHRAA